MQEATGRSSVETSLIADLKVFYQSKVAVPTDGGESAATEISGVRQFARRRGLAAWSLACRTLVRREKGRFSMLTGDQESEIFDRLLRVALVKQTACGDLYSSPAAATPRELLKSSWHRPGPIGLFTLFNARFYIVHPEPGPECRVGEEKLAYALDDPARAKHDAARKAVQSVAAVSAESVDWSAVDLVIATENAVPARLTRRYPQVLWATRLGHQDGAVRVLSTPTASGL
jgi:hypothetical protein